MKSYVYVDVSIKDASSVSTHHLTLSTGEVHVNVTLALSMDHSSTLSGSPEAMEDFAQAILREVYKARAVVEAVPANPGYTAYDSADDNGEGISRLTWGSTPKEAAEVMAEEKALDSVERLAYPT